MNLIGTKESHFSWRPNKTNVMQRGLKSPTECLSPCHIYINLLQLMFLNAPPGMYVDVMIKELVCRAGCFAFGQTLYSAGTSYLLSDCSLTPGNGFRFHLLHHHLTGFSASPFPPDDMWLTGKS